MRKWLVWAVGLVVLVGGCGGGSGVVDRSVWCRGGDVLVGVYRPSRLSVLSGCREAVGVVVEVVREGDGDWHVELVVKPQWVGLLGEGNLVRDSGLLPTEVVPVFPVPVPYVGQTVRVWGPWVLDRPHGWNEIHPVWHVEVDTGRAASVGAD